MSNVRYRQIVRDYERRFAHQVRLPNCQSWRMGYVDAQIAYLEYGKEKAWWHVGNEVKGTDLGVYGFKCPVHAAVLQDWSKRCGIDWSIRPEEQADRPPGPASADRRLSAVPGIQLHGDAMVASKGYRRRLSHSWGFSTFIISHSPSPNCSESSISIAMKIWSACQQVSGGFGIASRSRKKASTRKTRLRRAVAWAEGAKLKLSVH